MATLVVTPNDPSGRSEHNAPRSAKRFRFRGITILLWTLRLASAVVLSWLAIVELRTSFLQSAIFSHLAGEMRFTVGPGPSHDIRFPHGGPKDERLGYAGLPSFIERLGQHHFVVERQATLSPRLDQFVRAGFYAVYREKSHAGFSLLDRAGTPLYETSYPAWSYTNFQAIPPIIAKTLLFIEDRNLLDTLYPDHNPAVDWNRFLLAASGQALGWLDPRLKQGGASTLATQIEKFQHSPAGRTGGIGEKLRQMATASARAYLDGPDTTAARQRIVTTYLNATPLSSRPGDGEIIGVGNGLWVWYGTDFSEANRVLAATASTPTELDRKAMVYKQVLSLLLAQRRPSYYLVVNRQALEALTERYLRVLCAAGLIDPPLRDAALAAELPFRAVPQEIAPHSFTGSKAADAIRTELLTLLHAPNFYSLDRFDLTARSTIDAAGQERINGVLSRLGQAAYVKSLGLVGERLLGSEDPSRVRYSVVLCERGADRNYVRIHADSLDEPFDINSGAKLILGSTAKLRTLGTYLNIVAELHDRYALQPSRDLLTAAAQGQDPLSRWAAGYLARASDRRLQPMLDSAMQRRYSASPNEAFFTGGGRHVFENFEKTENGKVPTVEEAFEHSINLAFIRLMRDVTRYYAARNSEHMKELALEGNGTGRDAYLRRFADQEGRQYLSRFYDDYQGLTDDEALALLASRTRPVAYRLAVAFRSVRPQASVMALRDFLAARVPGLALDEGTADMLYAKYSDEQFSLNDRGYLAGVHPLELWLVAYLHNHPGAARSDVMTASADERQEVYGWLFKTHNVHKQDVRIRILLEEDAFDQILQDWRRQGYPFDQLVPSLATAIGSSGDRPDALAQLMGVILNDGVMVPTVDLEQLHFAGQTPYETEMAFEPQTPKRVFAPEVAQTMRRALMGVVAQGTGARLRNTYFAPDGTPLMVGGKTGTGDNRLDSFTADGRMIDSRVVDRTATFVFFLGDRFFGTITGYVPGSQAADYRFTSALAVELLKALGPQLGPLINTAG